jgi:predicted nuclease of predicted toxin-antitoxin system
MGVSLGVVEWLRRQGHDAKHLRDEGLQRSADVDIFDKAIAEKRAVLTFDLDFGEIAALSGGRKASVILFRLHNTRTPHLIDRLSAVLADCMPALERGSVVIVEESRYRVRPLPVGSSGPE